MGLYYGYRTNEHLDAMIGKTMVLVRGGKGDDHMVFTDQDGVEYVFTYEPDCCASCDIEDIVGDLDDLLGTPITVAEETTGDTPAAVEDPYSDSYTWTFITLGTNRGRVTVRWYGSSNGYYSEEPSFYVRRPGGEVH